MPENISPKKKANKDMGGRKEARYPANYSLLVVINNIYLQANRKCLLNITALKKNCTQKVLKKVLTM